VRQTRQAIRRARREHPAAKILATGCAVQLEPDRFRAMPEVDRIQTRDFTAPLTVAERVARSVTIVAYHRPETLTQ